MLIDQSFIPKSFQLTNELNAQKYTYNIQVNYLPSTREINFSKAISDICALGLNLHNCHIFYLDFQQKLYVHIGCYPFQTQLNLEYYLFLSNPIKLRFRKLILPQNSWASERSSERVIPSHIEPKKSNLKKKVKERTIGQAQYYVREWRNLYEKVDYRGKRLHTLQSAAKEIGIPNKSLDDYSNQFRLGQTYGFKFQENLHQKMGLLRKFVRISIQNQALQNGEVLSRIDEDISRYIESSSDSQSEKIKKQKKR